MLKTIQKLKAAVTILTKRSSISVNDIRDLYFKNSTINLTNTSGKKEVRDKVFNFFQIDEVEKAKIMENAEFKIFENGGRDKDDSSTFKGYTGYNSLATSV